MRFRALSNSTELECVYGGIPRESRYGCGKVQTGKPSSYPGLAGIIAVRIHCAPTIVSRKSSTGSLCAEFAAALDLAFKGRGLRPADKDLRIQGKFPKFPRY